MSKTTRERETVYGKKLTARDRRRMEKARDNVRAAEEAREELVVELIEAGYSNRTIAAHVGLGQGTISSIAKRHGFR